MSFPTNLFAFTHFPLVLSMITFTSVHGCVQFPQREVTAMTFTASGFTLSTEIVYSENPLVQSTFTSISHNKENARKVIENLINNAVTDVLQEQGRNAFLPDAVISSILQQINITIDYTPLQCKTATKEKANMPILAMKDGCFIIDDVVTSLCLMDMMPAAQLGGQPMPGCTLMPILNVEPIPLTFRTIKGSLRTSNVIMANWSRQMWQSVLSRVFQRVVSGRFQKFFSPATTTVNN